MKKLEAKDKMIPSEIEEEIKRLRMKKMELANKMNISFDFEERDELEKEIERIDEQIKILEKIKS